MVFYWVLLVFCWVPMVFLRVFYCFFLHLPIDSIDGCFWKGLKLAEITRSAQNTRGSKVLFLCSVPNRKSICSSSNPWCSFAPHLVAVQRVFFQQNRHVWTMTTPKIHRAFSNRFFIAKTTRTCDIIRFAMKIFLASLFYLYIYLESLSISKSPNKNAFPKSLSGRFSRC